MNLQEKHYVEVDCHKDTIACYINGKFKEFRTDFKGFSKALEWVNKIAPNSAWAIEGAYSYGLTLSKFLLSSGCEVYEFNALVTAKARKALSISGEKNDMGDAKVISIFANQVKMQEVSLKTIELKRLISNRRLIVKQRTEVILSIKSYCVKEGIMLPFKSLTTKKAINWLLNQEDFNLNQMAKNLKIQSETIKEFEEKIQENTPEKAKKLKELTGIDTLTASIFTQKQKVKRCQRLNLQVIVELHPLNVLVGFLQDLGITSEETELLTHYSILFQFFNQDLIQKVLNIFKRKLQKVKARNLLANTLPDKFLTEFGRFFLLLDL